MSMTPDENRALFWEIIRHIREARNRWRWNMEYLWPDPRERRDTTDELICDDQERGQWTDYWSMVI